GRCYKSIPPICFPD
nr:Chain C, Trypsin inhibitor 1 [Helianthus annuus]